eukprot:CAMPEP_0119296368 /NCGR_PEP_ID=MMETSP1329-20130426/50532_1 /TAXON_ID=114041 /ORGANISM="Genus nov. species nov., Strain RCC1024" /LENGTH=1508 /DNA_ID=CAMNT_0007297301 /DNA_START=138 /DNA_END=4662 /DNA_ORIENTATION=-
MYRIVLALVACASRASAARRSARAAAAARRLTGGFEFVEFDDSTLRPAVAEWFEDRSAAEAKHGSIDTWDTRRVRYMNSLFCARSSCQYPVASSSFNADISRWQTGKVVAMDFMFMDQTSFNQDISRWNTSAVTTLVATFSGAASFNQPIGRWDTRSVTDMTATFQNAAAFNQPLRNWNIDAVQEMSFIFASAASFDQELPWCVSESVLFQGVFFQPFAEAFSGTACGTPACAAVQSNKNCPDRGAAAAPYCELDPASGCSGLSRSFVASGAGPFGAIRGEGLAFAVADLAGDGAARLVAGDKAGTLAAYERRDQAFARVPDDAFGLSRIRVADYTASDLNGYAAPAFGDLDGNGFVDLILGMESGDLAYFRNTGDTFEATGNVFDNVTTSLSVGFRSRPALADLDADGLLDLVVGSSSGLAYYRNVGSARAPAFAADALLDDIKVEYASPFLADVDRDDDVDLVLGSNSGRVYLYRNVGSRAAPIFLRASDDPFAAVAVGTHSAPALVRSAAGFLDLLVASTGEMAFFRNAGVPEFEATSGLRTDFYAPDPFEGGALPWAYTDFGDNSAPAFGDADGDGLEDIVVGDRAGGLTLYRNTGSRFERVEDHPFFDEVDVGYFAAPAFGDVDGDGYQDLVVGSESGTVVFRNTGAGFELYETPGAEKPFAGVGRASGPAFGDIDGDGLPDAVFGGLGDLEFFRNTGLRGPGRFVRSVDGPFGAIDIDRCRGPEHPFLVGRRAAPTLYDVDGDGRSDLVLGCQDGSIALYRNTGAGFERVEDHPFAGIRAAQFSAPAFGDVNLDDDVDGDGRSDLVLGCQDGSIALYRNTGAGFERVEDHPFAGIRAAQFSAPAFGDVNLDGLPDLVIGDWLGFLATFTQRRCSVPAGEGACSANGRCQDGGCECPVVFAGDRCQLCAAGFEGPTCQRCPVHKWSAQGVAPSCEFCERGFYRDGDECIECAKGMVCDAVGVTLENVRLEKNLWRASSTSARIETCALERSCRSSNGTTVDAGENLCRDGHHGPLCAVCDRGYYRSGVRCRKCRASTAILTVVGGLCAALVLIFFVMIAFAATRDDDRHVEEGLFDTMAAKCGCASWQLWFERLEAVAEMRRSANTFIKQMSVMFSIIGSISWIYEVQFPGSFQTMLDELDVFAFFFTYAMECTAFVDGPLSFRDILLAHTLGPFLISFVVILFAGAVGLYRTGRLQSPWDWNPDIKFVCAQLVLLVFFLSYTSTSTSIFRALRPCDKLDQKFQGSKRYMHDDYSTSCSSTEYKFIFWWGVVMLFVFTLGVPLVPFAFLWTHYRHALNPGYSGVSTDDVDMSGSTSRATDAFHKAAVGREVEKRESLQSSDLKLFELIFDQYEPDYWWFELAEYGRMLLLTGLAVVFLPGTALQSSLAVFIQLCALLVYVVCHPYLQRHDSWFACGVQLATLLLFLAALMVKVDAVKYRKWFTVALWTITLLPLGLLVLIGLANLWIVLPAWAEAKKSFRAFVRSASQPSDDDVDATDASRGG